MKGRYKPKRQCQFYNDIKQPQATLVNTPKKLMSCELKAKNQKIKTPIQDRKQNRESGKMNKCYSSVT